MADRFDVFYECEFSHYSERLIADLNRYVASAKADYILNVNETQYVDHLISKYQVEPLALDFEAMSVSPPHEKDIPGDLLVGSVRFTVDQRRSYKRPVVAFYIPFAGDRELLGCRPNPWTAWATKVYVENGCLCFDVIDLNGDPAQIRREKDSITGNIRKQHGYLLGNISQHNATVASAAPSVFGARKQELLRQNNLVSALGLPIRKAENVPATFAVPVTPKKVVVKPDCSVGPYSPEPVLDSDIYGEILRTIHEMGRVLERLPSTYSGKDEEALRDYFILQLEPRLDSGATGETFNKSGKTDMLIRHEKQNVFVGECKFWHGQQGHLDTVDQILSYLTWRDSKAAIVYFVKNKEITAALEAIERSSGNHPCFVALKQRQEESWFSYEFHLPGDPGRAVHLAVLCFHLPPVDS